MSSNHSVERMPASEFRQGNWLQPIAAGCAVVAFCMLPQSLQALPVPVITAIVNKVQASNTTSAIDSYGDFLAALPVNEGSRRGYWYNGTAQGGLIAARKTIHAELARSLGAANVSYQKFTAGGYSGVNIVGVLHGIGTAPRKQYLLGAHYDSVGNPGADDDASGIAGLLEAARVLCRYQFSGTIIFVAFDQEEERSNGWGKGSQYYANQAKAQRVPLQAMVGLDMVAYNHGGANRATLSRCGTGSGTASAWLSNRMRAAFQNYSGLTVSQLSGEDASDPYLFHVAGFPAMLVIEQCDPDGWPLNPYYHEAEDFWLDTHGKPNMYAGRPYIDVTYASRIVRGIVGWAATDAGYIKARAVPFPEPAPALE